VTNIFTSATLTVGKHDWISRSNWNSDQWLWRCTHYCGSNILINWFVIHKFTMLHSQVVMKPIMACDDLTIICDYQIQQEILLWL